MCSMKLCVMSEEEKAKSSEAKRKKDRKALNPQAKELIVNVVNFMKREASGEFVIPARKVQCRAAQATGFSERTVRRVMKESRTLADAGGEGTSASFPPKKVAVRPKPKTGLDELTRCSVRKIIHGLYVKEKAVPTIKRIHLKLVEEIGFKGGSRSAHKIVKELGFFWRKTPSKAFVLIEKHEIRIKRIEYLRDIIKLRREGRPIVYIGDICIVTSLLLPEKEKGNYERLVLMLAGGERGFVPNAVMILPTSKPDDRYNEEITSLYHVWIQNSLLPDLPPRSVIVISNAQYQYIRSEKVPASDCNVEQMKEWLTSKNISFDRDMLRPELHKIIKKHAPKYRRQKGKIEQLLTERGHCILKLPPDHPDLNPVDLMLTDVRNYVKEKNLTLKIDDMNTLIQQKLTELVTQVWMVKCNQVQATEQQYLESEKIMDHEIEKLMAKPIANKETPKIGPKSNNAIEDEQPENMNFARQFVGGFLGVHDYRVLNI